jgi:endonuclease I
MKIKLLIIAIIASFVVNAQQTGYYNGADGKDGEELKTALNDIIKGHTPFTYRSAKYIFNLSDADPVTAGNVILVYTGRSNENDDYGTGGNKINREHVWAKSHGNFADRMPMHGDVHNLKPADGSVNVAKSNKDFDNGGTQHSEATGCYYTDSTWEARDEVKGDIARIIFYMATRYEGNDGESDLEVVDWNNTYPNAEHGKLSTLLEWNLQDPPDEFERNRNNVICSFQKNRNPFIDNPEFAQLIWGGAMASVVQVNNIIQSPLSVFPGNDVNISATVTSSGGEINSVKLYWGTSYESLSNQLDMTIAGSNYEVSIPAQAQGTTVYYSIVASDGTNENTPVVYDYFTNKIYDGELVSIYDIQGQQNESPYNGQVVTTSGIVTANLGMSYFIQNGTGLWNGLFIYESGRNPSVGDSVVITGKIEEYYGLTEMKEIDDYYFVSAGNDIPEYVSLASGDAEESHEGILVKVTNTTCTNADFNNDFGMWTVDDGSGELKIRNTAIFEYGPVEGDNYDITGPMNWDYNEWKIELRYNDDVVSSVDDEGPFLIGAEPIIRTNLKLMFDEFVDKTTAEDIANYSIDNGVVIESASQHAFNKAQVNLTVSEMPFEDYILIIKNMKDLVGNVTEEQTFIFSYLGIEDLIIGARLNIFPNPVDEMLNIEFIASDNADVQFNLVDITGKVIVDKPYNVSVGSNSLSIDVSSVSGGIYFLKVSDKTSSIAYKIVVR